MNSPLTTIIIIILGAFLLFFGIWTFLGLLRRNRGVPPNDLKKKKLVLGVCADFSSYVGIPLWIVRLYALVYAPFLLGLLFYLLYYLVMKLRKSPSPVVEEDRSIQITRMDIHRY
ncbi:MAG: PspC domain-containing protein [SAR324 cluster bacterium]|nr:PspC domain-containing protein [SAR324 cluster bacterium]